MSEYQLKEETALLKGVSLANHHLLTHADYSVSLMNALSSIGSGVRADCSAIFIHEFSALNPSTIQHYFLWSEVDGACQKSIEQGTQYATLELASSYKKLSSEKFVVLERPHISSVLLQFLPSDELASVLLMPIYIEEQCLGTLLLGFDQVRNTWSDNEIAMLKMATDGLGGKIKNFRDETSFRAIVEGTSARVGEEFFRSLVRNLASSMPVYAAYVAELTEFQNHQCRVLVGWEGDHFINSYTFDLRNTPCEEIIAGMMTYSLNNAQETYPKDFSMARIGGVSYAGVPCFDGQLKIIGALWVVNLKPITEKNRTLSILKMFAARAGAELERKRSEDIMKNMAYHDALTGLPNRVLLNDRLKMVLAHAQRHQVCLAVLFIDLDGFKEVNDSWGHGAGDIVLQGVAERLKQCIRQEDTVARLGGDEFIVLMSRIGSDKNAASLAQKILDIIEKPFYFEDRELKISVSIGISVYPDDGNDAKTLLRKADTALYRAKNKGKNTYFFTKDI
ncbi:MAG: sensor domain-containing diguanylate cyclase [Candidatus Nitrohelix vancouverensis]|uniref:Sensor domain-containing diguanylate cyclase n=1 Tax=Candidatus Nitrohelix vancouverensis TaxID=2705534 RepID=A0A7T0C3G7_9BACT|nr:MAG: sensor domain-containing diguanylate cyclase [Candidatus Nitrohelix vancouverensis]